MPDPKTQFKEIPLTGKLVTAEPAAIGSNFRALTNMRYTDTHPRAVQGMTTINSAAINATYLKARNAFHFKKSQPAESHVLAQAYNAGLTASQVLENTAAIPATGDFSATALWSDTAGAGRGYFSDAPDGQCIYANSVDTCIWGGNEMRVGAFITSTAAVTDTGSPTSPKDNTDIANNTKQDSANVIKIGGEIDSYTVLMLHGDGADGSTTITDSSASARAVTASGATAIDTAQAVFGTGSIYFPGTWSTDYATVPDSDDFYITGGDFTVDFRIRFSTVRTSGLLGQYVGANDYFSIYYDDSTHRLHIYDKESSAVKGSYYCSWTPVADTWYHVAFVLSGTTQYIFIDGISQTVTITQAWNSPGNIGANLYLGYLQQDPTNHSLFGWLDELRISKGIARWTANFSLPSRPYMAASRNWLIGSPRPLQGLKYYISNGNTVASTLTAKEWNGSTWNTLSITDNTDTGASLAVTGTVTFSSTVATAKPKYIEGYYLYWYQFSIDAGEADIYHVTLDAPFQGIVDIWDGVLRDVMRFYKKTTTYLDNTTNVLADDYYSTDATTYSDLSSMAAYSAGNNCLEIGFTEKMAGMEIRVAPEYTNSTAATTMTVDYWNGTEYTPVGTTTDGTSEGSIALAKSGVVTWNNNAMSDETKKVVSNSPPLYFYRVRFDKAMDASVRVNYVGGISAQKSISHYKFPVFAQGRVLLCADMAGDKNKAMASGKYLPQVYNGDDSVDIYFGEEGELTAGTELFSQFGSSLYSLILMFKDTETWVMAGQDINEWANNTFLLAAKIGCPAPLTLQTINLAAEPGAGINRTMAIWQGSNGIYMSDGRAPIPVHNDIKEYFDRTDSRCIKAANVGDSCGFIDPVNQEYHWIFYSGSSATLKELVYDIQRNRWFEIDRTSGKRLACGITVHDTNGNAYNYGFTDAGDMMRLENGNDFDGEDIACTMHFGDMALAGLAYETQIDAVKLITVSKTTTSNSVTCTHVADCGTATSDVAAQGTITMSGVAVEDETFVIDTQTFTWKTLRSGTGEVTIGAAAAAACTNLIAAINADLDSVTASAGGGTSVVITAADTGEIGNLITFTEDSTNMAMDGSGVLGGTTAGAYSMAHAHTMSPAKTGYRVTAPEFDENVTGDPFHSLKFEMTTDNEPIAFEPLAVVIAFHPTAQD